MALTGNCIATTLVGSKFVSGVAPLLPWMAVSSFFGCVRANHLDQAFQLGHRPNQLIWIALLAGIIAIGLSIYLIPGEGPVGAAIAVAVAMVVACAHAMIAGRYAYPLPFPIAAAIRIGICCAMMALVVIELPNSGWTGLFLRIGFGSVAYALSAITVNLMDSRERAVRFAKRAARRWTASRDTAALK
jgi:O-antigen/teichoic acid export membrane protein